MHASSFSRVCRATLLVSLALAGPAGVTLADDDVVLVFLFPQLAIGDGVETVIDIANQSGEDFQGTLYAVNDNGYYFPVIFNDQSSTGKEPIAVKRRATRRFTITKTGAIQTGQVAILTSYEGWRDNKCIGNATYRLLSEGRVRDSLAVPSSRAVCWGSFLAENRETVTTGVALANPHGAPVDVTLRAYSNTGGLAAAGTITLPSHGHQAFFLKERLPLPNEFQGFIEFQTRGIAASNEPPVDVFPLVLRSEQGQLSSVPVARAFMHYSFLITFDDKSVWSGSFLVRPEGGALNGRVSFEPGTPYSDSMVLAHGYYSLYEFKLLTAEVISTRLLTLQGAELGEQKFEGDAYFYGTGTKHGKVVFYRNIDY